MKEKRGNFRIQICMAQVVLLLVISGCSHTHTQDGNTGTKKIANLCLDLFEKAAEENRNDDLEMIRTIINRFGENGYSAVDSNNQIDMTEKEQVVQFCQMVEEKKTAEITLIEVTYLGGFISYELRTEDGVVLVNRSFFQYNDGKMEVEETGNYTANFWHYTKEGYLMFSGVWFSEEMYLLTLGGVEEYKAFRVQPLDEVYREMNRKYLKSIGYERNNMFLVDWDEADFGEIDFYDVFDIFYPMIYGKSSPYVAEENLGVGAVYQIPKDEFESVIMTYFSIDSETLQSKTVFDFENLTYEYKPRGFEEVEYPEYPYSEVVGYSENTDGTITLTVNVVFPFSGDSKVYSHEVVVRPMEDGGVQYVSNHIIPSDDNGEASWHTPRLTEDEWESLYGKRADARESAENSMESAYWMIPQAHDCIFSDEEKEQLQNEALSAAESVREIYQDIVVTEVPGYASGTHEFTYQQQKEVVEKLGEGGLTSVGTDINMQNREGMETFYKAYLNGQDSMVSVYEVQQDGRIATKTFVYRGGRIQTYYVGVCWKEGGIPKLEGTLVSDVAEINLTEKGYFFYAYKDVVAHASLRQYWRIAPLSDRCRELTRKYISGLSYVNYNVLVKNWDSSNVEDILMPCMYEDIYRLYYGKNMETENCKISAEEYEEVMTTYFPVSVEQLRENCGYDERSNCYEYEMISASPYPPFGEVVGYTQNGNGTITLVVDGVWPDYNSDLAFRNKIVIQPFEDGTFRYLSNSIEPREMELPPVAGLH